jgi:hypothetical protein
MVDRKDRGALRSKRKAITVLLPYAIRQERDGQPEMLDTFLHAVGAAMEWEFMWHRVGHYASGLLHEASPRALILVLPHIRWDLRTNRGDLVRLWATAVSVVPDTEEVASSVVDTLLQIASQHDLLPHIPADIWLWLTKQPPLPPICLGRNVGTCAHVVKAIRALKNIEVIRSYFLLVWSQWNHFSPSSFDGVPNRIRICGIDDASSPGTSTNSVSILILHQQILQLLILRPLIPQLLGGNCTIYITPLPPVHQPTHTPQMICVQSIHTVDRTLSHRRSIDPDSVLSHHTFDSSDSMPGRPSSRVLDSTSSRRSSSSSDSTPSSHMPNSVSVRLPPPDSTLYSHPAYVVNSVASRSRSISPVSISILQVQVLQSLIPQPPVL